MLQKLNVFSKRLELLAPAFGISFWWHFRNQDFLQDVLPDQDQSPCAFCMRIKEAPCYGLSRCRYDHMERAFKESLLKRESFLMTCHAGLILLCVPFFLNEELIGVLFAGPERPSERSGTEFEKEYKLLPLSDKEKLSFLGKYLENEIEMHFSESDLPEPYFRLLPRLATHNREILACAHLMRKLHRKKISVEDIARSSGIGESSLKHKFKRETGICFSDWLSRLRVSDALHLVEGTDLSFSEIASTCGFSDQSRMTVLFRRYLARTPGELRRKTRKEQTCSQNML